MTPVALTAEKTRWNSPTVELWWNDRSNVGQAFAERLAFGPLLTRGMVMNSVMKSLQLSVLLGSCFLLASGDLRAEDATADPIIAKSIEKSAAAKAADAKRLASITLTQPVLHESPPGASHTLEELSPPHDQLPPAFGPSPSAPSAQAFSGSYSVPREGCPLNGPCASTPNARNGFLNNNAIISDQMVFDSAATERANRPYQHPAPEVVLRFSSGCTDAAFANWSLSSRDAPRSRPAIPHGPLMIELRPDVERVDFVELILDGEPLKPTGYTTFSPLRYQLSCPAIGQHSLRARYLSGNIWSYYSTALQFEVRLPHQPRIIAVSDFDRDPTPPTRNGLTSITTHSIKVHLANVARGESIVAYVDGKPVSTHLAGESCCRIIKVEGFVAPGVHKLVARTVGCPGSCSITSQPSNTVMFHYYDEDVYLLRPGAGCKNDNSGVSSCVPKADAANNGSRPDSRALMRSGTASGNDASNSAARYTFVNLWLAAPNPAAEAGQLLGDAQKFRDLAAANAATVKTAADATANHAAATSAAADTTEIVRDNALAAYTQADLDAKAASGFEKQTAELKDAEVAAHKADVKTANDLAQAAYMQAQQAFNVVDQAAKAARSRADACQTQLDAAVKSNVAASEFLRVANEALARAQVFANDAQLAQVVNGNAQAAEQARQKTAVELGKIQNAQQAVSNLVAPTEGQQLAATELRRLAEVDLAQALRHVQLVNNEAKTVGIQTRLVRSSFQAASALAGHSQDPGYLLARSHTAAAQSAFQRADAAARQAAVQADAATFKARGAKVVADAAHALSADAVNAIAQAGAAERAAMDAAQRADAAVRKADIEAAKFPLNSAQANVAHRAAAATRDERDAAHKAANDARAAYYAPHTNSAQVAAGASDADLHSKAAQVSAAAAQQHAQAASAARNLAMQARDRAEQATTQLLSALQAGNNVAVVTANSTQIASANKLAAEQQALEAEKQEALAMTQSAAAANYARLADAASDRARLLAKVSRQAVNAKLEAVNRANAADSSAAAAGRTHQLQSDVIDAWDNAEVTALQDELLERVKQASESKGAVGVQRAEDGANFAETLAEKADAKAAARIREYEANARTARADNVNAPPSPFYFASAAHFPLPEFGLRRESLHRDGVLIYEDMVLHFDRDGNYEVHFRASAPEMPTTIRLQFQIQPCPDRPWYTITLAPIEFPYPPAKDEKATSLHSSCSKNGTSCRGDQKCCGEVQTCVCKGHSEILRRCYAEMGQEARIRRSGSARFGFGIR